MAEQSAARQAARSAAAAARKALGDAERAAANAAICARLIAIAEERDAKVILSYRAFAGEVDLTGFHDWCRETGRALAFPVTYGKGRMEAWLPLEDDAWEVDRYGILMPQISRSRLIEPQELELVAAPCVAFDAQRNRMGWGGGYYDRYLPQCRKALKLAVAFECQRSEEPLDVQSWDVPLERIITDARIY